MFSLNQGSNQRVLTLNIEQQIRADMPFDYFLVTAINSGVTMMASRQNPWAPS